MACMCSRSNRLAGSLRIPALIFLFALNVLILVEWLNDGAFLFATVLAGWLVAAVLWHRWFLWSPSPIPPWIGFWFCIHFVGVYFGWYETSLVFDKSLHAGITAIFAWYATVWLTDRDYVSRQSLVVNWIPISFALASASAWELLEFTVDKTGLFTMQVSLDDTMMDVLSAAAGGLAATVLLLISGLLCRFVADA